MEAPVLNAGLALDKIIQRVERHSLNPKEYIESRFVILNKQQKKQLLVFNRLQARVWEEIEELESEGRPIKIDILKFRQGGVSTQILGLFFDKVIRVPGTSAVSISHEDDSTHHFRMIIKRFYRNLPSDERPRIQYDKKGLFYFPDLDSSYYIWTAGGKGVGRAFTANLVHASEIPQWPGEPEKIWAGLLGSATPDAWLIRESTPEGMGWWYKLWLEDKEEGAAYTPLFFPWWWQPEYRELYPADNLTQEEMEFLAKSGADLYQLAWRRARQKEFGELFWQEYPEDEVGCFLGLETCVFDVAKCKKNLERVRNVKPLMVDENGALKIWKLREPGRKYVAGMDLAEGNIKGDPSALGIIDWETGEAVAQLYGRLPPDIFTYKAAALCHIYNDAYLAVERKSSGLYALGILTQQLAYANLYYHRDYDSGREKMGWITSHKTRPVMIENLATVIREDGIWVPDEGFWRECLSFVRTERKPDGEAAAGQHDDRIFAYGMALEIRKEIGMGPVKVQEIKNLVPSPL